MAYWVREIFDTLQGEGARAGARSIFVRLSGCNLWDGNPEHRNRGRGACAEWCDTDFRKGASKRMEADEIVAAVMELWLKYSDGHPYEVERTEPWVVLTGGEPALQFDGVLSDAFRLAGIRVALETNGTTKLRARPDWITVSPKLGRDGKPLDLQVHGADEYKVVLPGAACGWSDEHLENLRLNTVADHYYVQPGDLIDPKQVEVSWLRGNFLMAGHQETTRHIKRCIDFVTHHPEWRLGLQTHKYVDLP